jgi:uncharacterized protein (DUF169 family)
MQAQVARLTPQLLQVVGLDEEPLGILYTDEIPSEGFSPQPMDLPTRQKELQGDIDWQLIFSRFSCAMGHVWRARKKKSIAYFTAEQFGCPGASFWLGFNKPQTETIIKYVTTGIPNWTSGELYCASPDTLRRIFAHVDPRPAPHSVCVIKPISRFADEETPELVAFFARPESLCGLHQLAFFVTDDPEVVVSPWSAGCGSLVVWPLHYLEKGENKAVIGGWDPSARKYYRTDELSFTVPFDMFNKMVMRFDESFLTTSTWVTVRKKIERSKKAWGEI